MRRRRGKPSKPARSSKRSGRRSGWRVAAGLVWKQGRVLLLQRHHREKLFPLKWEFPGGKIKSHETPEQALERELREELGIRCRSGRLLARYRHRYRGGLQVELWFFDVASYRGRVCPYYAEQARWIAVAELPRYELLEGDARLVQRLLRLTAAPG